MDSKEAVLHELIKRGQDEYSGEHLMVAIPGYLSKTFVAYCAMQKDLELIDEYIEALQEKPNDTIASALTYSIISLYGKCYTDASRHSYPKLEPSELFKSADKNLETHNLLMELRHNFIAHRGDSDSEVNIAYMLVPKTGDINEVEFMFNQAKQISFSPETLSDIVVLVHYILDKLKEKIERTINKLHSVMVSRFTAEELALMTMNKKEK